MGVPPHGHTAGCCPATSDGSELALVRGGVPVVLGCQYSVLDTAAVPFAETFYKQLAAGATPPVALWRARLRLRETVGADSPLYAIPALYLAAGFTWPRKPLPSRDGPRKPSCWTSTLAASNAS